MTSFVEQFQQKLEELAAEIAETLVEYPNGLPDEICAVGEVADAEKVQSYISDLLSEGDVSTIEDMLSDADDQRENESDGK